MIVSRTQTVICVSQSSSPFLVWSSNLCLFPVPQDLYCVRSDLGNLLKALGRLEEAKVCSRGLTPAQLFAYLSFV